MSRCTLLPLSRPTCGGGLYRSALPPTAPRSTCQRHHRPTVSRKASHLPHVAFLHKGALRGAFTKRTVAAVNGRAVLHTAATATQSSAACENLTTWMTERGGKSMVALDGDQWRVTSFVGASEPLLRIPEKLAITTYDVQEHERIATVAAGRDNYVGLSLWVLAELAKGTDSEWALYLASLPQENLSPVFWDPASRAALLKGSPVLPLAEQRSAAIDSEYAEIEGELAEAMSGYPLEAYSQSAFRRAFGIVLQQVQYLPSANVLALIPFVDLVPTSCESGAMLDYDVETAEVMLYADCAYSPGDNVKVADCQKRPNSELLLARGVVDMSNPEDYLDYEVELLRIDPLFSVKLQILQGCGMEDKQSFPLYKDRFPQQLLSYLRLTRIQKSEELIKLGDMQQDVIVSQMNEYEILQLMMADCRERLGAYDGNLEDEIKILQRANELTPEAVLAAQIRTCEKGILGDTMTAIRKRLAPIRGIPTKQGMEAPNADIIEIFDTIENLPNAPKQMWNSFSSWARGDHDK